MKTIFPRTGAFLKTNGGMSRCLHLILLPVFLMCWHQDPFVGKYTFFLNDFLKLCLANELEMISYWQNHLIFHGDWFVEVSFGIPVVEGIC